jgi:hypothetical protein
MDEAAEIHELAFTWAHDGWFTYEVEWDPQNGIHYITLQIKDIDEPACMSLCEFDAFLFGLRIASARYNSEETDSDV